MDNPEPPRRTVPWLIFDGDCAFCTSTATFVERRLHRPGGPNARLVPWQFSDLAALGTTEQRARSEVLWVRPDGQVTGGATAFADWLRFRGGVFGGLGRAMGLPGVRVLAGVVYRFVARYRGRLPGGSPACALPAGKLPVGAPTPPPRPTRPPQSGQT